MTAKCQSNMINFHLERSRQGRYPGTLPETNMFAPLKMEWLEYDPFLLEKKRPLFQMPNLLLVSRKSTSNRYHKQCHTITPNSHTASAEATLRDTCLLSIWEVPTPLLGWLDLSSNWWEELTVDGQITTILLEKSLNNLWTVYRKIAVSCCLKKSFQKKTW